MAKFKNFFQTLVNTLRNSSEEQKEDDLEKIAAKEQKQFSFETLVSATKGFHPNHLLRDGGFGPVYKGKLDDGREIVVQKLSYSSNQGKTEFETEARLLTRVQHRNIVNLFGYCVHDAEKLLVYEYVAPESLDKLLFDSSRRELLDWKRRHGVITGVARGLRYLHEDTYKCIIHRDIQASNILMDKKWAPKIVDFGMVGLSSQDQMHTSTRVTGINGYMAPEFVMHGHLSVKADVYSFGVLVLELISGQSNSAFNQRADAQNLLDWAYKLHQKDKSMEMVDPILASSGATVQIKKCIHIGLLCTQGDPQLRPTMRRVVVLLLKLPDNLENPTKPGLPGSRYRRSHRKLAMSSKAGTSGDSTSHTFDSASHSNSTAAASSSNKSGLMSDPRGKRPIHG